MDEDLKQISDYFESWQLAEYLGITAEELILAFEDEVFNKLEELKELMGIERD